jgi:ribonuclease HI
LVPSIAVQARGSALPGAVHRATSRHRRVGDQGRRRNQAGAAKRWPNRACEKCGITERTVPSGFSRAEKVKTPFSNKRADLRVGSEFHQGPQLKTFYIDGAGARPDGTGSGFGWARPDSDETRVRWKDRLTNNVAEYSGLLAVLRYVARGSRLLVLTDSMLLCEQFNRRWACRDPDLQTLLHRARELIEEKELTVQVKWIPRAENLAGRLLDRVRSGS